MELWEMFEAPEILWTWSAIWPGLVTGSMREVWMTEQDILQKALVRPGRVASSATVVMRTLVCMMSNK